MRNILVIVFALFSLNLFAQGKFDVQGDLAPTGAYGIVKARNLRGGYLGSVYDTIARNLIPSNYRDSNTLVYTRLDSTMWMLKGGLANSNWAVFSTGGGVVDTFTLSTRKWRQKGIDSLNAIIGTFNLQKVTDLDNVTTNLLQIENANPLRLANPTNGRVAVINNGITNDIGLDLPNNSGTILLDVDTTNKFLSAVSQPNDSTLTFQKGTTSTSYTIRASVAGSATRLITTVYNNSGATITKGSVIYINGAHSSNLPTIALAKANDETTSAYTFGLVETNIANNSQGTVIQSGSITNLSLPTSTYTDGQTLYLSPTVAGGYTTTKPLAPNHYVAIGTVTRAHPTLGTIQIAIRNGFQLDELSDVKIALVPLDSTILQFSRVDSLWHDVNPTTAMGNRFAAKYKYASATDTGVLTSYDWIRFNGSSLGTAIQVDSTSVYTVNPATSGFSKVFGMFLGSQAGFNASKASYSSFLGYQAGYGADSATKSNFIGYQTGYGATYAHNSTFIGYTAGFGATNAKTSNFIGERAGYGATNATQSTFIGNQAGEGATYAQYSNIIGTGAGTNAIEASQSSFIGYLAGGEARYANNSTFVGTAAGYSARAANSSNFFGRYAGSYQWSADNSNFFGSVIAYDPSRIQQLGSNNTIIGNNITLPASTSNAINIGNIIYGINQHIPSGYTVTETPESTGAIGIGVIYPTNTLHVQGTTKITSLAGTGNRMVVANDTGMLITQAIPSGGSVDTFAISTRAWRQKGVDSLNAIKLNKADTSAMLSPYSFANVVSNISTNTTAASTNKTNYVYFVSGTTTITLPTAVGNTNRYTIKRVGTGVVSIATTASQTIDGSASPITINVQYGSLELISDGTNWNII